MRTDNIRPPIAPEYVLFGLILVNLGPLNILPNMYPPISVEIQIMIIKKNNSKLIILKLKVDRKDNNKKIIPHNLNKLLLVILYHS